MVIHLIERMFPTKVSGFFFRYLVCVFCLLFFFGVVGSLILKIRKTGRLQEPWIKQRCCKPANTDDDCLACELFQGFRSTVLSFDASEDNVVQIVVLQGTCR